MKPYVFANPEVQVEWLAFFEPTFEKVKGLDAKLPKTEAMVRRFDLEKLIERVMDLQYEIAGWVAKAEYFRDIANAEEVMEIYEREPKMSTTLIKAQAEGRIATLTGFLAMISHIWKATENTLISAQALLKKAP